MTVKAYSALARHYDALMSHIDYESCADFLAARFNKGGTVLDLGCGTGTVSALLSRRGFDVIGIDSSEAMLKRAVAKTDRGLFLKQDMPKFRLSAPVSGIYCVFDGVNYLTSEKSLETTIKSTRRFLELGGCFIFDIHAPGVMASKHGKTYVSKAPGVHCSWECRWSEPYLTMELNLSERGKNGAWRRFSETHTQREYSPRLLKTMLRNAGFTKIKAGFGGFGELGSRILFVCE